MTDSPEKSDIKPGESRQGGNAERKTSDGLWSRQEIESPCVKVCMIHPDAKICIGCYRTGDEIAKWSRMTPGERQNIMKNLTSRAGTLARRGGGRRGRIERGAR